MIYRHMYYLGNLRFDQGRFSEAQQCYQTSLDIFSKNTPDHFKTGLAYHRMATMAQSLGDVDTAE